MQCRNCGIEIAEKAIVCYKCGTATTVAKYQPFVPPPGRSLRPSLIVSAVLLVLLVALAVYMGRTAGSGTSPWLPGATVALAVAIVVLRAWARRR